MNEQVTAAVLIIGDEILSGRTKDANIGAIAERCSDLGIDLREARIVADDRSDIVAALNALRRRYTYVFTSGGIGPTHDDITADAVAAAFEVGISEDSRAMDLLRQRIKPEDLNAARRRMARIPHGAELVENTVSKAPGFWIGNVIVMAGVPAILRAMLDAVTPKLAVGTRTVARTVLAKALPEGAYAARLGAIAAAHPGISVGSYPSLRDGRFHNQIVVRGKVEADVDDVARRVAAMVDELAAGDGPA